MIALLLVAIACDVNPAWTALRKPPLAQQLKLELSTERNDYIVAEPIQFHLAIRNVSDQAVRANFKVYVHATSPKVVLRYRRNPGEAFRVLELGVRGHNLLPSDAELGPGKAISSRDESLGFDWAQKTPILDKPGNYEFQATYCDEPGDRNTLLDSNTWSVKVEPAPDRYRDAFEAYVKVNPTLAEWPVRYAETVSSEDAMVAFDFLEGFPDSPWAKHVHRGLVPTVESRVLHGKASPEEAQRVKLLREREAAQQQPGR
jgi:hypothetical protein